MATKSIMKSINIKNRKFCETFVSALENAKGKKSKEITLSRSYKELSKDEIDKIFGDEE